MRKDLLKDKLLDIIDSIEIIESRIVEIKEPDDFVSSKSGLEKLDSISMRLQVIGEIVSRINKHFPQLLDNYKSVVWKDIIGLRNIIFLYRSYNYLFCLQRLSAKTKRNNFNNNRFVER